MIEGLLGRKIGMTQVFSAGGEAIPVTVIEVGRALSRRSATRSVMATRRFRLASAK